MGAVAREVYADVREAIVGLRGAPTGLVPAIRDYLSRLPRMPGCEIELRVVDDGENVSLPPATEIQLVRIVQEALSNVRKHAEASHVEVVVGADGEEVELEIVDDGHGFDPLLRDPTGWPRLGLQTMRERAQAIGGALDLVSAPGHGTRIAVHVPVYETEEALVRVLLADDHALFRAGIASLLRAWGMDVVGQAADGVEAIELTRRLRPELVLMDVGMSPCNGLEATRVIKTELPDVKVIIVTVSEDDQDLFEAVKSGAEGYLLKACPRRSWARRSRRSPPASPRCRRPSHGRSSTSSREWRARERARRPVRRTSSPTVSARSCVSSRTVRRTRDRVAALHLRRTP